MIFLKRKKNIKELDELLSQIESNSANNYKDAAQDAFKAYEAALKRYETEGKLNEKQKIQYEEKLYSYKEQMKGFTHADQKPYWTKEDMLDGKTKD